MRVLCLGAGAIGGYFGGRLIEGGTRVAFLVRPPRKARLQTEGLHIESAACGNYAAPDIEVYAEEDLADAGRFDFVLLTCKAYDLDAAMRSIEPAVARGAAILPLLNGLAHLDILNARFGREQVLGGLAKIAVTMTTEGRIRHLNDWRTITFGEQDGRMSDRVTALKNAFDPTSITAAAVTDVMGRMWEKFAHLTTVASMTCLMRANVGEIARAPGGTAMMLATLGVMADLAAKAGYPVTEAFRAEYSQLFEDMASPYTASMLRDLEKGGAIEADHIVGYALAKAEAAGLNAAILNIAYTHLKAYEERRRAGRI